MGRARPASSRSKRWRERGHPQIRQDEALAEGEEEESAITPGTIWKRTRSMATNRDLAAKVMAANFEQG